MFRAIMIASMAIVPDPHMGSVSGTAYFQFANATSAAARFSLIGASHASRR